jgi:hypothetical protein
MAAGARLTGRFDAAPAQLKRRLTCSVYEMIVNAESSVRNHFK